MERKTFPIFIKQIDEAEGIVDHIFAVFGNVDEGLDVLHPGSFKKTISERMGKVRVLDQHNTDSIMRVLGKPLEIREIGVEELPKELRVEFPDATGGVFARTQFFLETQEGKGAFIRIKEGGINEWSFGYDAVDVDFSERGMNGKKIKVRNLRQVKLHEYAPVLWGMNPATATLDAKEKVIDKEEDQGPQHKAVTSFEDLPLGEREKQWDGDAAEGRVREWAGGKDDMDWPKYRGAFLWYDADEPELFGSYKLGYADVEDGKLIAMPRGVFAAAGALQGARGGVDIPAEDDEKVREHLAEYYAKMRTEFEDEALVAPWNKAARKGSELVRVLNAGIEALEGDERSRSDIVDLMGKAAGISAGTVNQILNNSIDCPPLRRLEGFALALDVSESSLVEAAEEDGCEYEKAATPTDEPPGEGKDYYDRERGLGDVLQGNIHYVFTSLVDKWYIHGLMNREERLLLSSLIGDALGVLHEGLPEELGERDVSHGPLMADYGYGMYAQDPVTDAKAGRVFSARNAEKLQRAYAELGQLLMDAGLLGGDEESARHEDEDDEDEDHKTAGGNGSPTADDLLMLIDVERQGLDAIMLA